MSTNTITFTRINNDGNGNPRYVCHYLHLLSTEYKVNTLIDFRADYAIACKHANTIGGRKWNNKQYGGGIVFSTYSLDDLCKHIARVTDNPVCTYTVN